MTQPNRPALEVSGDPTTASIFVAVHLLVWFFLSMVLAHFWGDWVWGLYIFLNVVPFVLFLVLCYSSIVSAVQKRKTRTIRK